MWSGADGASRGGTPRRQRLSPELADLARLIHWDGFSVTEAAQVLDLDTFIARTRYARARLDVRTALMVPVD
ncbi:hypothetical protein CAE01nite_08090 [Cellulomonas aerilata]|uniref:RNA polymerase sigma factor 70 region 4 type 2 domain-containing protein n=1 Tax=Cellulomonas aerilata TaxID=515326 RepID=A0A512D9B9_9CELL|nr:hypothetical protein CAE01nite_08090 [Cellulomonas aerilata]